MNSVDGADSVAIVVGTQDGVEINDCHIEGFEEWCEPVSHACEARVHIIWKNVGGTGTRPGREREDDRETFIAQIVDAIGEIGEIPIN